MRAFTARIFADSAESGRIFFVFGRIYTLVKMNLILPLESESKNTISVFGNPEIFGLFVLTIQTMAEKRRPFPRP